MIEIEVNNGGTMRISQDHERDWIIVEVGTETDRRIYGIEYGDMVMLINYYRYIKEQDIQCDFINPHGRKEKETC